MIYKNNGTMYRIFGEYAMSIKIFAMNDNEYYTISLQPTGTYWLELHPVEVEITEHEWNYAYNVAMEKIKEVSNG